jgi:DNA-binding transcriptional LysR family regulator
LNFNKLLYFKTIVEQGQISRAARVLNMSQPPLSQRLKELEEELGVTLIERTGTNWRVTTEGKVLYQRALHILDLINDIPEEIHASRHEVEGMVTIGCTTLALSLLEQFIPELNRNYPNISIRLLVEDSAVLMLKLLEHALDVCIMAGSSEDERLTCLPLPAFRPCLVVPRAIATDSITRAVQKNKPLKIEALHEQPLIILRKHGGGGLHKQVLELFRSHKVAPHIVMDSPSSKTMLDLLESGLHAMALVPDSEVPGRIRESCLVCSLPKDFSKIQRFAAQVEKRYLSRAARTAWDALKTHVFSDGASDETG